MQSGQSGATGAAETFQSLRPALATVDAGVNHVVATSYADYKLIRRNGSVVGFEPSKIAVAMTKAFLAVRGNQAAASSAIRDQVEKLTASVVGALLRRQPAGGTFHIEDVQDQVELSLMRDGAHDVARAYVLYREKRSQERARLKKEQPQPEAALMMLGGWRAGAARPGAGPLADRGGLRRADRLRFRGCHPRRNGEEPVRRRSARARWSSRQSFRRAR